MLLHVKKRRKSIPEVSWCSQACNGSQHGSYNDTPVAKRHICTCTGQQILRKNHIRIIGSFLDQEFKRGTPKGLRGFRLSLLWCLSACLYVWVCEQSQFLTQKPILFGNMIFIAMGFFSGFCQVCHNEYTYENIALKFQKCFLSCYFFPCPKNSSAKT